MNVQTAPLIHIDRDADLEAPEDDSFSCWITKALTAGECPLPKATPEVSLRIAGREEVSTLNHEYRGKTGPTNVLSFPADLPDVVESGLLGDIVICAPLVSDEAREQGKQLEAHWAHLTIHGVLHLRGYDHLTDQDAAIMEALEVSTLASLGFPDPYDTISGPAGGAPAS